MVIGAFPAAKLGILALKQISKPIANLIKKEAKNSAVFRNYVCMPPAQFYNWVEVKTKMWAMNLGKPVSVPPLNEAAAIELGANLLGEAIIFVIGAGALIFEYARQTTNESKKTEAARIQRMELVNSLSEMSFRLERQDAQIRELTRVLADLDSRSLFRWSKERLVEYATFDPNRANQSTNSQMLEESIYDSNFGVIFKALNFLETCIFEICSNDNEESQNTQNSKESNQSELQRNFKSERAEL